MNHFLDCLTRYEAVAVWLEGIALVLIFVWDRIDANQQHEQTHKQLTTAETAANAAKANGELLIAQNRAWLILNEIESPHSTQKVKNGYIALGTGFNWSIKNCGNSPAFIYRIGARFHKADTISDLPSEPDIETGTWAMPTDHYPDGGLSVGPGETIERYTLAVPEEKRPQEPADYIEIAEGKSLWVAYGVIEYGTVFNKESLRETRFCYRWVPGNNVSFVRSELPANYTKQT